jgi:tol-pal system protein YbgF
MLICLLFALTALAPSVQAGTKEELQRLQSDVLALQNQLRIVEKTFNEKTDGIRSLVTQLNDQFGKTNEVLARISTTLETQSTGDRTQTASILQEIRSLSTKVDDSATRISALAQQISEMKVQSKSLTQRTYQTASGDPGTLALSADTIYNEAFNDLVQGNFDLAVEGFSSFMKNFPSHERADDAQYNMGEAYYNSNKYPQAIAAFTRVLNDYPSGDKVASAYFKRAKAELAVNERENAIEDFKTVAVKYSSAPEAALAKNELDNLGIDISKPAKTGTTRRKR